MQEAEPEEEMSENAPTTPETPATPPRKRRRWLKILLISVAVVVLGGTSLLGGRGFPLATVVAAVFLEQLVQFVVALGVPLPLLNPPKPRSSARMSPLGKVVRE